MSLIRIIESAPVRALHHFNALLQSPFVSGPILAALTFAPSHLKASLASHLPPSGVLSLEFAEKAFRVLFAIGVIKSLNRTLSELAANNYRLLPAKGWDWPNEIAVVTGGCSGIGFCVVKRLLARNVRVVILDVQDQPKEFDAHPLVSFWKCDVTDAHAVREAADAVRERVGNPTILINNAGIVTLAPILDVTQEHLAKIFAVNTMCHWTTVQQFLPHMIKINKGHIMTVASLSSFVALPKGAHYSATKAAALSFHESLACELKHLYKADSVLTSVAHPNFVRTPLVQDFGHQLEKGGVRMLTPDGVAQVITDQIFAKKGAQLIIPEQQSVVCGLRGWPQYLQVLMRDQLGSNAVNVGA